MTTDAFSAADSTTSTTGDDLSTTTEYKYAQMVVPNFTIVNAPDGTGDTISWSTEATTPSTPGGSSFLRLGSSPVTVTSSSSGNTYTYAMATASDAPTGFSDSLTLAKLVGNMDSSNSAATVASAEATTDSTSGITTDDATEEQYYDSKAYSGNKILGFADDTRIRDDASSSSLHIKGSSATDGLEANSTANRTAETSRLLSKGGWWDHSDGNRISTTAGDKIEVIQGNYKLVVLGRRAASDSDSTKVHEISGGYEFSKVYEYLESEDTWATYEESSKAHATKKTSGVEVSEFQGTLKKTIVGKDPSGWAVRGPDDDTDPTVISKTWAKSMETYVGSADKPVPHLYSIAYTGTREEITISAEILVTRVAAGNFTQISTGATIVDVKAAGAIIAVNAAPIYLLKADVAPMVREIKMGTVFSYNTTETHVTGNSTTFKGGVQQFTAKKEEVVAAKTELLAKLEELKGSHTELASSHTKLANNVTSLGLKTYIINAQLDIL